MFKWVAVCLRGLCCALQVSQHVINCPGADIKAVRLILNILNFLRGEYLDGKLLDSKVKQPKAAKGAPEPPPPPLHYTSGWPKVLHSLPSLQPRTPCCLIPWGLQHLLMHNKYWYVISLVWYPGVLAEPGVS